MTHEDALAGGSGALKAMEDGQAFIMQLFEDALGFATKDYIRRPEFRSIIRRCGSASVSQALRNQLIAEIRDLRREAFIVSQVQLATMAVSSDFGTGKTASATYAAGEFLLNTRRPRKIVIREFADAIG